MLFTDSMKQPHIYTLPERFLKDPAVPLRWKLYTILNGFWISGKPVFASNAWFAEKLGCSDRHVRDCLLELEKMYLITRHGASQKRRIIPGGHGGGTEGSSQGGTHSVVRAEPRVPHIADSIADRLNGAVAIAPRIVEYTEEDENARPSKEKDPNLDRSVKYWRELCKRETDLTPSTGIPTIKKILKNAHAHLTWPQIKQKMDEWFDVDGLQDHEKIQITRCFSTVQIDAFKAENV